MAGGCRGCRDGEGFTLPFSMAFQPIVDLQTGRSFAHEALVRGIGGEGAGTILGAVDEGNRYAFDQQCRVKAIELATKLHLAASGARLSINFMPNAVYEPRACIRLTLAAAEKTGFPLDRIIFEFTEQEKLDVAHTLHILRTYRELGFMTAIDDFGAGHTSLAILGEFRPDIVKLEMGLIRGVNGDKVKQAMVRHLLAMAGDLNVMAVCEGVETEDELRCLRRLGVRYAQGFAIAKPAFERLATPSVPRLLSAANAA